MSDSASKLDGPGKVIAAFSVVATLGLWLAAYHWLPVPDDSNDGQARLAYAVGWIVVAVLFGLSMAVEAVAHERLQSDAFDPLAGRETRRLRINQRYLQNTLEQSVLFAVGLLGLAVRGSGEATVRAITACAIVWIVTRYLFWFGYHRSAKLRVIGIAGLGQSLLVLVWLAANFGDQHWGTAGLISLVAAVLAVEFVLVLNTREKKEPSE